MTKSKWISALLSAALLLGMLPAGTGHAANPQLVVGLSAGTGAIKHGAAGFLYGLSDPGIPSDNMLIPLQPQTISQKAPDGLQHARRHRRHLEQRECGRRQHRRLDRRRDGELPPIQRDQRVCSLPSFYRIFKRILLNKKQDMPEGLSRFSCCPARS